MSPRIVVAAVLLAAELALAVFGAVVSYGFLAEYGDISHSPLEAAVSAFASGIGALGLGLVVLLGLAVVQTARHRRFTVVGIGIPVLMAVAIAVTAPLALERKREVQFDAVPQCTSSEITTGPGAEAARESQEIFDSIDHVGLFGGGGGSGVGGCDRTLTVEEDTDVIGHYRSTLSEDGWDVVTDEQGHLRAERPGAAFEVMGDARDWTVWAGPRSQRPQPLG